MTEELVIDASVVAKLLYPENDSDIAISLYQNGSLHFIAPEFLVAGVTNVIWKRSRQEKQHNFQEMYKAFVSSVFLTLYSFRYTPFEEVLKITAELNHNSIYDCFYLNLAMRRNCKLVTADEAFVKKCANSNYAEKVCSLYSFN